MLLEIVAVELGKAFVLVDFSGGLELAGAEVAAVLDGVCVRFRGRLGVVGFRESVVGVC